MGAAERERPRGGASGARRDGKLAQHLPAGVEYKIVYEPTRFVTESIREVRTTLLEAMLLVFLVVFVFLQSFRATLIPAITVPVSLVGTFALMRLLDFSVNTLTLFGLVLAIGLVVDDAIVVVENVARLVQTKGMNARDATIEAMREVTAPIVAISVVLMAVFLPVAFVPGTTGELYRQFALTIACSVAISAFNALTLSPALCALLLGRRERRTAFGLGAFDATFERFTRWYERAVSAVVTHRPIGWACSPRSWPRRSCSIARCPPRSCPRRISATSSSRCSCPTARRSSAPRR